MHFKIANFKICARATPVTLNSIPIKSLKSPITSRSGKSFLFTKAKAFFQIKTIFSSGSDNISLPPPSVSRAMPSFSWLLMIVNTWKRGVFVPSTGFFRKMRFQIPRCCVSKFPKCRLFWFVFTVLRHPSSLWKSEEGPLLLNFGCRAELSLCGSGTRYYRMAETHHVICRSRDIVQVLFSSCLVLKQLPMKSCIF